MPRWVFYTSSPQQGVKYHLWYLNSFFWRGVGVSMHIPWKICRRTAKFLPIFGIDQRYFPFNWLKCLGGFLHLKPTAGCQISTLIFDFFMWRGLGGFYKYSMKNICRRTAKFLPAWGLIKDIARAFNWLKCLGWYFCTSSPQQGVKYQLWYLEICFVEGGLYKYPMKNISKDGKVLPPPWHWNQRYCPGL